MEIKIQVLRILIWNTFINPLVFHKSRPIILMVIFFMKGAAVDLWFMMKYDYKKK